jgi:hypothetical protein
MQSLLPTITQQQQQQSTTTPNMNKNHTIRHHAKYDLIEHDFSLGPWWPKQTVDVAWCVEFTEHVGRNYMMNYHTAFRKAALIFVTHSNWGGWVSNMFYDCVIGVLHICKWLHKHLKCIYSLILFLGIASCRSTQR